MGIHVLPSGDENAVHWFLDDKANTKSSNYLEDAATEIQVQGLELDYTCCCGTLICDTMIENGIFISSMGLQNGMNNFQTPKASKNCASIC
ncbi:MAG: DUF2075 domain-containing protein [Clostridiales bacterium]|nr:MAG: DUF2075 domain-containing protein [Clostridiales bacterium]